MGSSWLPAGSSLARAGSLGVEVWFEIPTKAARGSSFSKFWSVSSKVCVSFSAVRRRIFSAGSSSQLKPLCVL